MSEWRLSRISDLCLKLTSGGTPKSSIAEYYGGEIPWLNTKEVNFNRIRNTEKTISLSGLKNSSAKWIPSESVIVAMYGATAGKVALSKIPLTTNQACCNLITDETKCSSAFLYYSLKNKYNILQGLAVGAAQQNLSVGVIGQVELSIPGLAEQKAIAVVLSSIDDKIDLLNRQNETLEAMAQTLFRQRFIEEADERWEEVELSFWITPKKGKILTKAKAIDGRVPVVAGGLEPACYHNFSNTLGPVITISASGANAGFVRLYFEEVWASDCSYIDLSVTSFIYFHYVNLKLNQSQLFDSQIGSAQPHVYPKHIESLVSKRYPIELIQEFEYLCEGWFSKIKNNIDQIKTLHQTRNTILPKLMSGEVRVKLD
jgi:type I restriction enzyme S subunit